MTTGPRTGDHFLLDPEITNQIGRGMDCNVMVADPLCSRVHAMIVLEGGDWWLRDDGSRNHTFLDNQQINEAKLTDGAVLRVGAIEFTFHCSDQPPTSRLASSMNLTQTIVKDALVDPNASDSAEFSLEILRNLDQSEDLLLLHQLAIRLLGCTDPKDVIHITLDLLRGRTRASIAGFLWVDDEGRLKLQSVLPKDVGEWGVLSDSLTELVCQKRRAVWVANQKAAESTDSLRHYADALCVPLIHEGVTLGAIHLYRKKIRFQQLDFDFAIALANILVVALVRARQQASLEADHRRLINQSAGFDELIGKSPAMRNLKSKIVRIARATGCVLVCGESGSGKELVARALHRASARADRPMLSVNCAAIPANLLESQLFGHMKGAFTGADTDHVGWFQQADAGTLFLDEVGEMTMEGQAKLLRIIEGYPFLPVGATKEVSVDVRVIAATNRDLREVVAEQKFREDLYYRLSVFELDIPPLRDRGDDIEKLLMFFFEHFKRQHGRTHLELSPAAREKILTYPWPGNVRQLRNVIDSAVVMAEGNTIEPIDLGLHDVGAATLDTLRIDDWERKLIGEALARAQNNVPQAARLLGIGRATLYRKIEEYGIKR